MLWSDVFCPIKLYINSSSWAGYVCPWHATCLSFDIKPMTNTWQKRQHVGNIRAPCWCFCLILLAWILYHMTKTWLDINEGRHIQPSLNLYIIGWDKIHNFNTPVWTMHHNIESWNFGHLGDACQSHHNILGKGRQFFTSYCLLLTRLLA